MLNENLINLGKCRYKVRKRTDSPPSLHDGVTGKEKKMLKKTKLVLGVMLIMLLAMSTNLMAATTYVNYTTGDDTNGDGTSGSPYKTFHKGYTETSAGNTIDLTGTFDWTNTDETGDASIAGYTIGKNLTIQGQGSGQTFVQAHSSEDSADRRVFTISSGTTVTIKDMTIRHGKLNGFILCGGGIYNSSTLTLTNCTVSGNSVAFGHGGGIHSYENSTLTLTNCTVSGNSCGFDGGGIYSYENSTLTLTNCTVSGNSSVADDGGGICVYGTTTLTNCTISGNSADAYGGGIYNWGATTHIKNTIIANNSAIEGGDDFCFSSGTVNDNGYNIVEYSSVAANATGGFNNATSILYNTKYNNAGTSFTSWTKGGTGVSGSLSLSSTLDLNCNPNGTETLTYTDGSSIGIDDGTGSDADQRGAAVYNNVKDIGAYEWQGSAGTLPITLSSFTAQYIENTPTLYWTTQSETDNMGWFVYRNDEEDFTTSEKISEFIEGHGTTTQQQSYIYEDNIENPEVGDRYYYWLESIDFSGMVNHYDKVAVLTIPEQNDPGSGIIPEPVRYGLLQNEPNPVIESTKISFNLHETAKVELNIYNLKGQLVKSLYSGVASSKTLDWNGKDENGNELKAGVYLYKLLVNGKIEETKKLILMK